MSVNRMEAEDENGVKKKNISEKCDENEEEKVKNGEKEPGHTITDSKEQRHSNSCTTEGKGSQTRNQAKEDICMQQDKDATKKRSPTMKNVISSEKESKSSLKCDKNIKSSKIGAKTQGNQKKMINGSSQVTAEKTGKSESGRTRSNSYEEKTCEQNTQKKMCKPCSDSDIESIENLRRKIDSAKASGKSINALLYEMNGDSGPRDKNKANIISQSENTKVSFSLQGDELCCKLEELTVSEDRVNKILVGENDLQIQLKTENSSDICEDASYQSKGPMSHPKHTQIFQPYPRPDQLYQQMPQQVPNGGDFFEAELQVDKFYDEEDLLKALNEIAPETHPHTSPGHYSDPAELLPCEDSFSEDIPLPNPCPIGVNNQFYLNPVQGVTPSQYPIPTAQPSSLPVDLGYMPCPDPQQRSTSADTIKQTPTVSIPYERRPNSYPSIHNDSLEVLFEDASDIIVNDLRQSNQQKSAQKTNINHPTKFSGVNTMHQARLNQQVHAHPISNLPVTRCQPSPNQGMEKQGTLGNQNLTKVMAAKPPHVLPNPAEMPQLTRQNPSQRSSDGNLPNILQEITDNKIKMKIPESKTPFIPTSVLGNSNYPGIPIQLHQSSQLQMATQLNSHPTGVHPAQPKVCDAQNPTLVPRQTLPAAPAGVSMNGTRPHNINSNQRGANPQYMIELTKSNLNPPSQIARPVMNQSSTVAHGKVSSSSQNMVKAPLPHGFNPYPSPFSTMTNPQMVTCVPSSQPMCNPQRMTQPMSKVPNSASPFIQQFPNAQNMLSQPYPIYNGVHTMPASDSCFQSMPNQNGQCMSQPVQVIICPSLSNDKPRFRKILPKPPTSVEGGK